MNNNFELQFRQDNGWNMERYHFHDSFEILVALSDGENFFVRDHLYPLRRGTLLVLGNAELHRSTASGGAPYERYVLHFLPDYIRKISTTQSDLLSFFKKGTRYIKLNEKDLSRLVKLLENCRRPIQCFGDDIRIEADFTELILTICELFGAQKGSMPAQSENFERITPIIDYIRSNLGAPLNLDFLSEKFFISKNYLCYLFKKATGFGVMEYIINCRVLNARTLLEEGKSVQEAGEESGFNNNSHFIRTFHNMVGSSPGRYARNCRNIIQQI